MTERPLPFDDHDVGLLGLVGLERCGEGLPVEAVGPEFDRATEHNAEGDLGAEPGERVDSRTAFGDIEVVELDDAGKYVGPERIGVERREELGAVAFLRKPASERRIINAIRQALGLGGDLEGEETDETKVP